MNRWSAVVHQEILCISRERLPQLVLAVFLGMIAASAFIGSAAKGTVSRVYQEAVNQGLTTAANPFDSFSPLYYARNTVIYIVLIGALLAIVVGVQSTLRDRRARTADLVFSRELPARLYLGAKLCGLGLFLLVLLAVSAVINILCIAGVSGQLLSPAGTLRMLGLYGVAWLFLIPFVCLGMLSGLYSASGTTALFVPIVIWSIVIFVLPLLGTAAEPISLLNPVSAPPAAQTGFFALTGAIVGPLSLGENFKQVSALILGDQRATGTMAAGLLAMAMFAAAGCAFLLLTRRRQMRKDLA